MQRCSFFKLSYYLAIILYLFARFHNNLKNSVHVWIYLVFRFSIWILSEWFFVFVLKTTLIVNDFPTLGSTMKKNNNITTCMRSTTI